MMREIRFRAWDERRKTMYINPCRTSRPKGVPQKNWFVGFNYQGLEISEYEGKGHWHKFPIMQFTGLFDCHGKEIYEGDVLGLEYFTPWVVKWDKAGFCVYNAGNPERSWHLDWIGNREVIGNIFESPELLK
jgi:hypothetical protein